jgi:hypothetical protein
MKDEFDLDDFHALDRLEVEHLARSIGQFIYDWATSDDLEDEDG